MVVCAGLLFLYSANVYHGVVMMYPELVFDPADFAGWNTSDGVTSVRIDADGRIRGFYAPVGACHLGYLGQGVCVPPDLDTTLTTFNQRPVKLVGGETIRVGFGTIIGPHASEELPADQVVQAQSDLGAVVVVLHARYYPNVGLFLSGKVLPDVPHSVVARARLGYPSGHWAYEDGRHKLVLFHWVLKPGFEPTSWDLTAGLSASTKGSDMSQSAVSDVSGNWVVADKPSIDVGDQVEVGGIQAMVTADGNAGGGDALIAVRHDIGNGSFAANDVVVSVSQVTPTGKRYLPPASPVVGSANGVCDACAHKADPVDSDDSANDKDSVIAQVVSQLDNLAERIGDVLARLDSFQSAVVDLPVDAAPPVVPDSAPPPVVPDPVAPPVVDEVVEVSQEAESSEKPESFEVADGSETSELDTVAPLIPQSLLDAINSVSSQSAE